MLMALLPDCPLKLESCIPEAEQSRIWQSSRASRCTPLFEASVLIWGLAQFHTSFTHLEYTLQSATPRHPHPQAKQPMQAAIELVLLHGAQQN